jgi:protein-S-isoprenylcysteine O-methyltransferase Ste14
MPMKIEDNSPKVRFPPPLVFIGFLLIGLVIDRVAGITGSGMPVSFRLVLAAAAAGPGIALVVAALGGFRQAKTPPEPWREVTALVKTGVYRFTRNPMYLGMAGIYFGLALGMDSIAALALLPIVILIIQTKVIAAEEAYMLSSFGSAYRNYCNQVRRWL